MTGVSFEAVADSVATLLPKAPAGRLAWSDARAEWQTRLVEPLFARLGRILAHRAAEVCWGADAGDEFLLRNDPDIQAAMGYWDRLGSLLGGAAGQ